MTEAKVPRDLFSPGAGGFPPYLAGRDEALKKLAPMEASLREGRSPSRDVVVYGPRGNGKTVLINAFLRRAGDKKGGIPKLQIIRLTPDDIPDVGALYRHLVLDRPGRRLLERIQSIKRLYLKLSETKFPGLGIGFDTPAQTRLLPDILRDRARAGPTVLAVDAAHVLDPVVGQTLLNLVQKMRDEEKCPVLLMLVGTPGLKPHLGTMKSTFWNRGIQIAVDLLDERDAAAALTKPLADYSVTFDDEALQDVVAESDGYPFFIQLWGGALTRDLAQGQRITGACVDDARPAFEKEKNAYFAERYSELERRELLKPAERLTPLFADPKRRVREDVILAAIADHTPAGEGNKRFVLDQLSDLGYIWGDAANGYVPGIPSLIKFVDALSGRPAPGY